MNWRPIRLVPPWEQEAAGAGSIASGRMTFYRLGAAQQTLVLCGASAEDVVAHRMKAAAHVGQRHWHE